jgi:dimethylargininase
MTLIALTRAVPPSIERCELTHLQREPIDYARAAAEHDAYEACLRQLGCVVQRLPDLPEHPDSVFVEDTAVVFERVAVIARPGASSRRGEIDSSVAALCSHRPLAFIQAPGTLDGGDVLVTPGRVFVGVTGRTNAEGARQLADILERHGYTVTAVPVAGCLHLKSAVTLLPPEGGNYEESPVASAFRRNLLVINPSWVDPALFSDFDLIDVDPSEPMAANVLTIGETAVCAEPYPRTRRRIEERGTRTVAVPAGELAKAEGGVTCCAILVDVKRSHP